MGDCFAASSWFGENGFIETRKWIAGRARNSFSELQVFGPGT